MTSLGDSTLMTYEPTEASANALITGPLGRDDNGCFTVDGLVVLVPNGAQVNSDTSITLADGNEFAVGDEVKGGGGMSEPEGATRALLDDHCAGTSSVWWFSSL